MAAFLHWWNLACEIESNEYQIELQTKEAKMPENTNRV